MSQRLPLELILLVIEVGGVGIQDAITLRSTCRHFYEASKQRPYWLSVAAVMIDAGHVLLESPFKPLSSLSAGDLFTVCKSTQRSITNLSSETPRVVSHDIIPTRNSSDADYVLIFMSLSGGSHFITIHLRGTIKIWDARRYSRGNPDQVPETEAEKPNEEHPPAAVYRAKAPVEDVSYSTTGSAGARVILALLLSKESDTIQVVEFELPQGLNPIEVHDFVESPGIVGFYMGTLHVQDSLVAALGSVNSESSLHISVFDYKRNLMWVIDTGLDGFKRPWDMFSWGEDWILFREDGKTLTFHAWFDVPQLLSQTPELPGTRRTINHAPDSSRTVELANPLASANYIDWMTIHPWNTPNHRTRNLIPASGSSRIIGDDDLPASGRLMYRHDIDPDYISHILRRPETPMERPHRFSLVLSDVTEPSQPLRSLWITSTCGKRWVWIGRTKEGVLQLATLLLTEMPEHPGTGIEHIRILDVPFDLSTVAELDFWDETATLVLLTKEDSARSGHKIHLLRF
ncbi:hypothetical protein FRC04_002735 [Tulasnella sp. 424]|nr:hypothetical protein FRC04_002735 [Tulasnella sp. 424]KAG8974239.1 hypothetical protein FRC05_007815 [Tulasnella sp. 425]